MRHVALTCRFAISLLACLAAAFVPAAAQRTGSLALSGSTTIPFVLSGNHIFVRVNVDGKPFAFVFDTGGAASLSPESESVLKLPAVAHAETAGAGGVRTRVDIVTVPQLTVGDATYSNGEFPVLPSIPLISPFKDLQFGGLIGRELMRQAVVTIDYAKSELIFTNTDTFTPPPGSVELPLTMYGGVLPSIPVSIDGHKGVFNVDAGASTALTLGQQFGAQNTIASEFTTSVQAQIGRGVGGPFFGTVGRLRVFQMGSISIPNPIVAIASDNSGIFSRPDFQGNIGAEILRRFTVTLDIPGGKFYVSPNAAFSDPFLYNRSGMSLVPSNGQWIVDSVVENGPAAQAGVQKGDVVASLDGQTPAALGVDKVRDLLRDPKRASVSVVLNRNGQTVPVTVLLRDLI